MFTRKALILYKEKKRVDKRWHEKKFQIFYSGFQELSFARKFDFVSVEHHLVRGHDDEF